MQSRRLPAILLFPLPAAALYGLFVLWPIGSVFWLSLFQWTGFGPQRFLGLQNLSSLLSDPLFRTSMLHSLLWEACALVVPTVLALGLALLIRRARLRSAILAILFFPVLLPPAVVAATWGLVYSPVSGLIDVTLRALNLGGLQQDWLGDPHLALPALFVAWLWSVVGVSTLILTAGLLAIGREWFEIAALEGAGPLWRFRHVILPGLRRPLWVTLLVNAALSGAVFDLVFVTTGGGPGYATMLLPLEVYGRTFGGQGGGGAAAACIQIAIGLLLAALAGLALLRRHDGLEAGLPEGATRVPMSTATLVLVTALGSLPLLWLVPVALAPGQSFAIAGPTPDPGAWRLDNFASAWNAGMASAALTSLGIAVVVVAGTLLLAVPAAFALADRRLGRRARFAAAAVLLVGLFQATPAVLVPLFTLLNDLGLLDTLWGVLFPEIGRALPFAVLLLWAFLSQTPRDVLEAAQVDGASDVRLMISIALPIAFPALLAIALWTFATSWNEYLLPTLVSQDGSLVTVPTLLASFIGRYNTELGVLAAGSLMAVMPSLAVYLLLRHPAAGGLAGAEEKMQ